MNRKPLAKAAPGRAALSAREAEAILRAQGFELVRVRGSHHIWRRGQETLVLSYRRRSEPLASGQQSKIQRLLA
jgi:predicted RNA binding protein YcfA (HicA-like mRNA interferase family)